MKDERRAEAAAQGGAGLVLRGHSSGFAELQEKQKRVLVAAPALCLVFPRQWHSLQLFPCFKFQQCHMAHLGPLVGAGGGQSSPES